MLILGLRNFLSYPIPCFIIHYSEDIFHIAFEFHPKLRKRVVGARRGRVKMNVVRKVLIDFPVDNNGELDLSRQKAIAETRRKAYEVKNSILSSLEELTKITVKV